MSCVGEARMPNCFSVGRITEDNDTETEAYEVKAEAADLFWLESSTGIRLTMRFDGYMYTLHELCGSVKTLIGASVDQKMAQTMFNNEAFRIQRIAVEAYGL